MLSHSKVNVRLGWADWVAAFCVVVALGSGRRVIGFPGFYLPLDIPAMGLMVLLMAVALRTRNASRWILPGDRTLVLWLLIFVWVGICSGLLRSLTPVVVRQLRDTFVPFALGVMAAWLYVQRPNGVYKLPQMIVLGICVHAVDFIVNEVLAGGIAWASAYQETLDEEATLGYATMGAYAALMVVACLCILVDRSRPHTARIVAMIGVLMGVVMNIISANRASLAMLVLGPVVYLAISILSLRQIRSIAFLIIGGWIVVATFPGILLRVIPDSRIVDSRETLYGKGDLVNNIRSRAEDWVRITREKDFIHIMSGYEWETAFAHSEHLTHPHNIFLWMQFMGGLMANVLFGVCLYILWANLSSLFGSASSGPSRLFVFQLYWMGLVLMNVMLSNSWSSGIPVVFGLWWGIVVGLLDSRCRNSAAPMCIRAGTHTRKRLTMAYI